MNREKVDVWEYMKRHEVDAFEEVMRNAVSILKGPSDPRIEEIIAYMRKYKANIDAGRKVKPGEYADEKVLITSTAPPPRHQFRRF
jgi:hypothetical protein